MTSALSSAGSRIVLMGTQKCANDRAAPPVPSVESTMDDLAEVLTDRCGADPDNVVRVLDAADPMSMGIAVADAAEEATDVLLVHYVGHGFPGPDGELYLATRSTDPNPNRLQHNSLRWDTVRRSLLNSRASALVVILDCCFSGRASERTLTAAEPVDLADVRGGYILTAGARDQLALAPKGQRHTAFTGELIRLLRDGDPDSPSELRMRHIYRALDRRLRARSLPPPFQRNIDQAENLVLAENSSGGTGPSTEARRTAPAPRKRRPVHTLVISLTVAAAVVSGPLVWWVVSEPLLPPTTECKRRSTADDCGDLPARATNRSADTSMVSLVRSPTGSVVRYKQASATAPVGGKTDIGGNVGPGGTPAVVPDARGRMVGFAIGEDGVLRYDPNVDSGSDDWSPVASSLQLSGTPAVSQDSQNNLVVVARGTDGTLWRILQTFPGEDSWKRPEPLPEAQLKDDPTIHLDRHGSLRVFALGTDDKVHTWAQEHSDYTDWKHQVVGGATQLATSPTTALDGNGQLRLFARGRDRSLQQLTEEPADPNVWPDGWTRVGPGPYAGKPLAVRDDQGTVTAFARCQDVPDRVTYVSNGGWRPDRGKSGTIQQPMDDIVSATLDEAEHLVVQGIDDRKVVSAFRD